MDCKMETTIHDDPDDIVISGISGKFPSSDSMKELQDNLLNKVDLGSDDERRWLHEHPEVPRRTGRINDIDKFDAEFFDIPIFEVHQMDPMARILLECVYEAIVDAGVNPKDLYGTKTGVFTGTCYSEIEEVLFYDNTELFTKALPGCSRSMMANRISYWLGITGSSNNFDSACSSSLTAMDRACRSIWTGQCEAAIVVGMNICLHPYISLQFARLGLLSSDGTCKVFDDNADGYLRSEAIVAIYLQRLKNSKRAYATVVYTKANSDGYKEQGITFPSSELQTKLLKELYEECNISPVTLDYIEAHGTGTYVGDLEELDSLDKVFCKNRKTPLLIGSVKSNMGHSEPASGLCQIAKIIIAMETGMIPPNINFKKHRSGVKAFENGTLRVVTEPTIWKPGLVGINSFGFGGSNVHVLLRSNQKEKVNKGIPDDHLPRLVVMSGRTEQAVESFLSEVENRPIDIEYIRLLHDIFAADIPRHPYRGYVIIESERSEYKPMKEIQKYLDTRRPICFVFSGIGSQWLGMGQALLQFAAFAAVVEKCDKILRPYGVHIGDILTNKEKNIFNDILNSIVGITVMQIGLIELLKSINVTPDHVIGHSIGELCCGYITDNFSIEQVILSAYYIGVTLNKSKIIRGAMMNIAVGYEETKSICPSNIEISSFSPNVCCLSGPKASVKSFATNLQMYNILTKKLECNNIPFHSHYLVPARAAIFGHLKRIIPQTMTDSRVWRSSVFDTQLSYAEYFTNNLLNSVFFEKVTQSIPENAIMLEIAPDGILQDVMREFSDINIALLQRNHKDNVKVLLQGLGKMYNNGLQPQLANLYPSVQFPVSRGTPMISPSIKWNHSDSFYIGRKLAVELDVAERIVDINLKDETYEFMSGHVIDDRTLLPATGYLFLVWETFSIVKKKFYYNMSVVFEDVKFLRPTYLRQQDNIELVITIQQASGNFEITQADNVIVTGKIRVPEDIAKEKLPRSFLREINEEEVIKTKDFYKELKLRGYQYSGAFRGFISTSASGRQGHIKWFNWISYMDCMLQLKILRTDTKCLYVPTGIRKLVIDTDFYGYAHYIKTENEEYLVQIYDDYDTITSGDIEISGIKVNAISLRKTNVSPILERYEFVTHCDGAEISFRDAMTLSMHLVLEQHQITKLNVIEMIEDCDNVTEEELASPLINEVLNNLPLIKPNINLITRIERFVHITFPSAITISQKKKLSKEDNAILVTGIDLLTKDKKVTLKEALLALKDNGFLLVRGQFVANEDLINITKAHGLVIILKKRTKNSYIILLKKVQQSTRKTEVIRVNNYEFSWLEELKTILNAEMEWGNAARIILVGEKDPECGLLGLVNCLRREPGGELIRGMLIQDEAAPEFSLHEPLYAQQLELDLIINVLRPGKVWGSYRHLPLESPVLKPVYHAFVNQQVRGDLNSFRWLQGDITPEYQHQDLVRIIYAPINFKDVMIASGKVNMDSFVSRGRLEECFIGFEYVGIDNTGRRVMGITENRCISNMQRIDKNLCWYIPDEWTLEDAATIPCAYCTCYYALYIRAKMEKGNKILIHSGTGAVGQAAIHLSLHHGCEVFTTVGTAEKRKFIRDTFPSIPESHIGNSRDTSFEQMILEQTEGRGVDIVLNSLAEEKLQASIRCLSRGGCFLEIGKFDFLSDNLLDLSILSKGIKFFGIMLDNIFMASEEERISVYNIFYDGLQFGAIKPLSRKVFQKDEVATAFRYMTTGKHIGKVMIKVQEEDESLSTPIATFPRYYCAANKMYILLGGLGGFGLELADWLVIRGARNLMLISRTGIKNGYQYRKVELWKKYGVNVSIMSNIDASNANECEYILKSAEKLAPVDAIFNLAVVLNDKLCQNHTAETFEESFKAKAWATKSLDQLSRKICPQLRYFVVFSSVSCGRGNAGQTNYGMANSVMERICERRSQEGLHGLAIQWGAVGDVGLVADMMDDDRELVIGGTLQQKITSCLEKMEEFLLQEHPVVASMVVAEKSANSFANDIVGTVAHIMSVKDLNSVPRQAALSSLGMDSMMAVEIKQTLERDFDVFLTTQDIRTLNFAKLIKMSNAETHETTKGNSKSGQDINELDGIKLIVRLIGKDPTPEVLVDLPTKQKNANAKCELFLLPGLEACAHIFHSLAQKIEAPAICIQYGVSNIGSYTIISEIADCLLQHIVNSKKLGESFMIVGYSFGSILAIELAHRLEKLNIRGKLVLIDGAPELMKGIVKQFLNFNTRDELQNNILLAIMDNMNPAICGQLLLDLKDLSNWDEKLNIFMNYIPPSEFTNQLFIDVKKALCTTVYEHILALIEYDVMKIPKISSPIILLKPTVPSIMFHEEDYGLHRITTGNIEVHYVNGNHITILDSDKVLAAINGERIENVIATE